MGCKFMKKKLLLYISLFVFSMLTLTSKVNAFNCNYYLEKNTSSNKPDLEILNVNSAHDYDFVIPNSLNFIHEVNGSTDYDYWEKKGRYIYFTEKPTKNEDIWDGVFARESMLMFFSLYPNQNAYDIIVGDAEDDGDKCPRYLEYEYYTNGSSRKTIYAMVHTDDLDVDPSQPINIDGADDAGIIDKVKITITKFGNAVGGFDNIDGHGYLILEKYKDKSIDELIGKYNCLTYATEMDMIKNSVKDVGCENNQKFNKHYDELRELCNSFRESKSYADVEGKDNKAKSCSKACSNFKDDIAELCQLDASSGCGSLGPKVVKWLYKIIKWARYIIPVIIIILVMLEYIKALASEDEKAMKDATSHMFTRLMVAAIIFLLPFILDFILNLFKIDEMDVNNLFCQK